MSVVLSGWVLCAKGPLEGDWAEGIPESLPPLLVPGQDSFLSHPSTKPESAIDAYTAARS